MKKLLPFLVAALALVWAGSKLRTPSDRTAMHAEEFGRLPVLVNGRIKPLDTVARTTLLFLQNKQSFKTPNGDSLQPVEWLLDVLYRPDVADGYRHFRIDNLETLALFRLSEEDTRITYEKPSQRTMAALGMLPSSIHRFSLNQLRNGLDELQKQAEIAQQLDNAQRSPFQREIVTLHERVLLYHRLKHSLQLPQSADFAAELAQFSAQLAPGVAATRARMEGKPHDEAAVQALAASFNKFEFLAQVGNLLPVPPAGEGQELTAWSSVGSALLNSLATGAIAPQVQSYATLGHAYRAGDAAAFNAELDKLRRTFDVRYAEKLDKAALEFRFNHLQPFYLALVLFVMAFVAVAVSWLAWKDLLRETGWGLAFAAFILTTAGITIRMYLEGRPPVTNLYSSALFIACTAAGFGLLLDRLFRNGAGTAVGSVVGFASLIIAHNLSFGGDTMEMMRAVLDDNFWLATHVVVITLGYASMFIGGALGATYVIAGLFTGWLSKEFDTKSIAEVGVGATALGAPGVAGAAAGTMAIAAATKVKGETNGQAIRRMIYGILCFSTLFSLVGTILGGIWADQSWGRFWGWDPKENGALIIVLWCAIVLHARWGGMVKDRGLALLSIFGNVVTSWSWFGVNLLGVGLHSYGFTTGAFTWLLLFWLSNLAVIALGLLPLEHWRSFKAKSGTSDSGTNTPPPVPRPIGAR